MTKDSSLEGVTDRLKRTLTVLVTMNKMLFMASMHADGSAEYGSFLGTWLVGFFDQARRLNPAGDNVNAVVMEKSCAASMLALMRDMHGIPVEEIVELARDGTTLSPDQLSFVHLGTDEVQ